MNIKDLKTVVLGGPEDGREYAFIKGKTAYIVQADGMSDAMDRMHNMGFCDLSCGKTQWKLTNEKAVLIPGIWEYEMATFIG